MSGGYTDQRSDGDTERELGHHLVIMMTQVTQTNDPMGILKAVTGPLQVNRILGYTDQRSDGDTESSLVARFDKSSYGLHRPTIRWGY